VKYRILGERTGLRVSEIGLGAWGIGGPVAVKNRTGPNLAPANYGTIEEAQAIATIHAALDSGVNFIDTAPFYGGDGVSERRIGAALRGRSDEVIVATKVGVFKEGDEYRRIFTREVVRRQVEQSRQNLGRDVLDIELVHSPTRAEYGNGEALDELVAQKAAGRVRFIGFSIMGDPVQGMEFLRTGVVDVLEVPFSLLRPQVADALLPMAAKMGVGVIAREPLANGFLTGRFTRETQFPPEDQRGNLSRAQIAENVERAEEFAFLAQGTGRTPSQGALQWVLANPAITTVIAGAMAPGEARENAAVPDVAPLTGADVGRVRAIHERALVGPGR
jgi:aryl-alcohol dehydrogenase-like predicted oxidoreductase